MVMKTLIIYNHLNSVKKKVWNVKVECNKMKRNKIKKNHVQ